MYFKLRSKLDIAHRVYSKIEVGGWNAINVNLREKKIIEIDVYRSRRIEIDNSNF